MKDPGDDARGVVRAAIEHLRYYQAVGVTEIPKHESQRPSLASVRAELGECTRCPLCRTRRQIVFGAGHDQAELVFVGEGPGEDEDRQGEPFVGRAGQLLTRMIEAMGLTRAEVYIANVVKCLRYNALVQLGDGSWERIGRLVRRRYGGYVMSVDQDGLLVQRRVVGWHTAPLGTRRVFRLTYRSAKNAGDGLVNIQLTGDHPVLAERGWVRVDELRSGDRIATGQGLSALAWDVVCGTLLGDGHLNRASAHLSLAHSERQADYARFKASLLCELKPRVGEMRVAVGGTHYGVISMRTLAHRAISTLRAEFYRPDKRVPTWIAERLNERMLAFWFMDDGHTRIRPTRQPRAEVATCGFPRKDLEILLAGLKRLGLPAKALDGRIHFDALTTRVLSERIAPFVPLSMRYKLHPEIAARVAFDPLRLQPDAPRVLFDEAKATPIDHHGSDKTFFCLDVEETHNFVTAGGVVHNCRPPGNRAPAPAEIATCLPFLEAQLAAIRPRVICTLGAVATQALLKTSAKISQLRGRFHDYRPGAARDGDADGPPIAVMPTYHPAYLLRNPSEKKVVWDDLQMVLRALGPSKRE